LSCDHRGKVLEAYMSPGSVTEKNCISSLRSTTMHDQVIRRWAVTLLKGEDIEVVELPLTRGAADDCDRRRSQDGKTIMLLQHAAPRRT